MTLGPCTRAIGRRFCHMSRVEDFSWIYYFLHHDPAPALMFFCLSLVHLPVFHDIAKHVPGYDTLNVYIEETELLQIFDEKQLLVFGQLKQELYGRVFRGDLTRLTHIGPLEVSLTTLVWTGARRISR